MNFCALRCHVLGPKASGFGGATSLAEACGARPVFVYHVTAVVEGRNKELPGIAETDLRATSREVKEEGLELSITEGGNEGKSKVTAFCSYLEDEVRD